jgi:uncharacterized protein YecT (DUF1311 family)
LNTAALTVAMLVLGVTASAAEPALPRDTAAVQDCLQSERGRDLDGERCIGVVANPCLEKGHSTAEQVECTTREFAVWDAMLNADYKELQRSRLDRKQNAKLRDMQRAWVASRDRTCAFYWDYHQGSMAAPMTAYCTMRETARRVMFLRRFVER